MIGRSTNIKIPGKKKKVSKNKAIKSNRRRLYYSLLSILLLVCVIQALRGVYLNVTKYVVLNKQIHKLETLNSSAQEKNKELKKQIQNYTSIKGIEALARDNLKMVGEDEVLVVIKQTPAPSSKKNKSASKAD